MNYKSVFRSQKIRFLILKFLSFIPDSIMLGWQYRIKMNRPLNLKNPQRFTEKLQWYKINYRNPLIGRCVNKYLVREYVESKGLGHILNKLYAVYDSPEKIDFESLPDRYVIKSTDGSGGENILIINEKKESDRDKIRQILHKWKNKGKINAGREWAYTCIDSTDFIIEEYLENDKNPEAGISDYKFFCFRGKPFCIAYDTDRYISHKRNFYDIDWNNLSITSDCPGFEDNDLKRPEGLTEMIRVSEILSADFPFVRVDLYYLKGRVYFGELTFYPWSGYVRFDPDSFDYILGEQFELTNSI